MEKSNPRQLLLSVFLMVIASNLLWAGGKADDFAFEPVSGESHWTYTVNLEELEGKRLRSSGIYGRLPWVW